KLRSLWMEMEFTRLLRELPSVKVEAPEGPVETLESEDAVRAFLARMPDTGAIAIDWAGDARPPEPALAALSVFHPDVGVAVVPPEHAGPLATSGRELVAHDAKALVEAWLARGIAPPRIHDTAVAAYLLNSGRATY